ncbi:nuclear protein localization protein 4, putative [Hepatocystis sp. ex Piliocolobus tephrosceles]|nr:nuclear protein localization protein 4, putative [Hepatocystis sp. ex Piliocolobus tephrosceles]
MNEITVRLRCEIGIFRIMIEKDKKIIDLKIKINELLSVPVQKQELFRINDSGRELLINDSLYLSECNIYNGSIIELKSDFKPVTKKNKTTANTTQMNNTNNTISEIEKGINSIEKRKKTDDKSGNNINSSNLYGTNDILNNSNNNNNNNNSNNIKKENNKLEKQKNEKNSKTEKDGKLETNFKSFDHFLQLRGYNTTDLPLNMVYKSIYLQKGKFNKIPLSITLKHQEYRHVDHLELMNIEEIKNFVNYWCYENNMLIQRAGWMYGYYKEDPNYTLGIRAVCECIYEPPQKNENNKVKLLPDDYLQSVDLIAERLGLERIGWIFTHVPRKEYLTSDEVVYIAKLQLDNIKKNIHYTNYNISNFITCTISPDPLLSNEPVINAFMISDLGMVMLRDNLINAIQTDPSHIQLRTPNKNELIPLILESGAETNKFDTDWLLVRINDTAPKVVRSIFKNFHFPRENRNYMQTASDVKEYFSNKKLDRGSNKNLGCSDFHLILFVSRVLDMETALALCDAALNKKQIDPIMEEVLTSISV